MGGISQPVQTIELTRPAPRRQKRLHETRLASPLQPIDPPRNYHKGYSVRLRNSPKAEMPPVDGFLTDWPGKSARDFGPEHPAIYHMLDVAAVAERLLMHSPAPPAQKAALSLLVALHDLGKIGDGFRNMIRLGKPQGARHWELTEAWLFSDERLAGRLHADPDVWRTLIAAVAGHHGGPSKRAERDFAVYRRGAGAAAARDVPAAIEALSALWPDASLAGLTPKDARKLSWSLAGLTVVADWVGSNQDWFPAHLPILSPADYLSDTRNRAKRAVAAAGLLAAPPRAGALFDFAPRPMQSAAQTIALPDRPMLIFVEDETGSGKTEAAFILTQRLLLAGRGRGVFFALPTMATADAMFARAEAVMGRLFAQPKLALAHGRARLSVPFQGLVDRPTISDEDVTCTPWLADDRRRALLADIGVGTVDQALLGVMPTRYSTVRMWGLASKILIVDEAHEVSGDHYMAQLLAALLRAHAAQGGSAILLSATLPLGQRTALARAFAEGAGLDWPDDANPSYPSLSIPGGDARRDIGQAPGPKGRVLVERLPSAEAAVDLLAEAVARGAACVWVRNAVDEAIAAVEALRARGVDASLLHARFALCDRKRIEAAELARFGRAGPGRAARVLVATQILESSLDLDFDVMVSDLAPIAALIQRAGRLWRHMAERPRHTRPVPMPVLHVLSPDPGAVVDAHWLLPVLGQGGWVYPVADQWRTAEILFRTGAIDVPAGLRDLIETVHTGAVPVPAPLDAAEIERMGLGYAQANLGSQNLINFSDDYRWGAQSTDDQVYPTRLGRPTRTLVLVRRSAAGLEPWAGTGGASPFEPWMLSDVRADRRRLDRLALPDQTAPEIARLTEEWPQWRRDSVTICPVAEDGTICEGLSYHPELGLLFEPAGPA